MNERRREFARIDRVGWWLLTLAVLALLIAADPPFGFNILSGVASVVAGTFFGLLVSRYYSQRASEELRTEAAELRGAADMILVGLADAGLIDARRDPDSGKVFSVRIKGTTLRDITEHPETMELLRRLERGEFARKLPREPL